jgi:hypothetical protein
MSRNFSFFMLFGSIGGGAEFVNVKTSFFADVSSPFWRWSISLAIW